MWLVVVTFPPRGKSYCLSNLVVYTLYSFGFSHLLSSQTVSVANGLVRKHSLPVQCFQEFLLLKQRIRFKNRSNIGMITYVQTKDASDLLLLPCAIFHLLTTSVAIICTFYLFIKITFVYMIFPILLLQVKYSFLENSHVTILLIVCLYRSI